MQVDMNLSPYFNEPTFKRNTSKIFLNYNSHYEHEVQASIIFLFQLGYSH